MSQHPDAGMDEIQEFEFSLASKPYSTSGNPSVATITGYTGIGGAIQIPSNLDGFTVVAIGNFAFSSCTSITSVSIPSSVISIGNNAFAASSLTSVILPDSVTAIGQYAFYSDTLLSSVTIGMKVASIGQFAFAGCTSLTSVSVGSNITGMGVFASCTSLTSVTLGSRVQTIGNEAFVGCGSIASVTFLGLVAPVNIGIAWINPGVGIGHAYALSNFPPSGGVWNGLTMGAVIPTAPGAPIGLTAIANDSIIYLSWSAPSSDGGSTIDHYVIYQNGVDVQHVTGTSVTITGLTNGQTYSFKIAANNSVGTGPQTTSISAKPVPPSTVPKSPTGLIVTPGNTQVSISWTAPISNGGATIDYYIVYQDGIDVSHPTATTKTITGLTNGQSYSFTVAAHNSIGTSLQTSAITATPSSDTAPGIPTSLTATVGDGIVTLSWTAPSSSGSSGIDYYIIYQNGLDVSHPSGPSTTITGLTNGQNYTFSIAAHNSAGSGTQSSSQIISPSASSNIVATTPTGSDNTAIYAGIAALLAAAIIGVVLVVRRKRKTV